MKEFARSFWFFKCISTARPPSAVPENVKFADKVAFNTFEVTEKLKSRPGRRIFDPENKTTLERHKKLITNFLKQSKLSTHGLIWAFVKEITVAKTANKATPSFSWHISKLSFLRERKVRTEKISSVFINLTRLWSRCSDNDELSIRSNSDRNKIVFLVRTVWSEEQFVRLGNLFLS